VLNPPKFPTSIDDGLLTLSEISRLSINADLVVLISCGSGLGDKEETEAFTGLARGFFAAGAKALIISLFPVDLDASTRLASELARGLASSPSDPAGALQRAMAEMRKQNDGFYGNPRYWSGFEVLAAP
jgi:CHAT domain-containing protein